jgi:DNA repair ATPase RecN
MLSQLKQTYQTKTNELHVRIGKRDSTKARINWCEERLIAIVTETDILTKASLFLQTLSDQTRQQIVDKISSIVTDALQKVKDPNLEFKMLLSTDRNQVDVDFVVLDKTTKHEYDIINSCGGSIADIISFPLRVSLLLKWEPTLSRVLILDEAAKFVSVVDQEPLGDFVRQVSERLSVQTIFVTHSPVVAGKAHRTFDVSRKDGESVVETR